MLLALSRMPKVPAPFLASIAFVLPPSRMQSFTAAAQHPAPLPAPSARTAVHIVEYCAAERSAEAVVKLLPREHKPAMVAPIALATSAAETGQNRPE